MSNSNNQLVLGALVGAAINAVINGTINWFQVKDQTNILLTQDSISSAEHTVIAGSVMLAVSLAFILTTIAHFTTKSNSKPAYFPRVFLLAIKHSAYAFGLVTIIGVLIQRYWGSIEVSPISSALVAGLIAGLVAGIVDYETKRSLAN